MTKATARKNDQLFKLLLPILFFVWLVHKLGEFGISITFKLFSLTGQIISLPLTFYKSLEAFGKSQTLKRLPKHPSKLIPEIKLHKKHRGRPRKQPLINLLFQKYNRIFNRIFPNKLRIAVGLTVLIIGFFTYSIALILIAHELPSPENIKNVNSPLTTQIFDRNGELLYKIYEGKNRSLINLSDVPPDLVNATIAIEDKNFYTHSGVDFYGILRAATTYIQSGNLTGGSTITQQLIKNTLLTPERTLKRKVKEVILAFWLERISSKRDILEMYFNEVPYGGPAWGIAAASETYFNKKPKELSLAESAYLAGLPASPTVLSPYGTNPDLGKHRQKEVLRRMVEEGFISEQQSLDAFNTGLQIQPSISQIKAPHFVMYVRAKLAEKYGEKAVSQGGLQVTTTLDQNIQESAELIVAEEIEKLKNLNVSNGAAMVTDPKNGHILAMVGSKNFWDPNGGNFNVTTALRQPGSSIKPITYATGFKEGYTPATLLLDSPVTYKNAWETYSPVNYDGRFHGVVTIRTSLGSSYNIPAVKMLSMVGMDKMLQTAKDLGISTFTSPSKYGLSITLGGADVKMVDMMTVYGTFAQLGKRIDAQPILKVTDSNGDVLEDNSYPESKKVIPSGVAYMISNILADEKARQPAFGPNSLLNIPGYTVAVKTGTTDSKRDNWTFGYNSDYVVGVWVGNNDNSPMDPKLASGVTGAAPIWNKIMNGLVKDKPDIAFSRPPDISEGLVDGKKDLILLGQVSRSALGQSRNKTKDVKPGDIKENITFTDPFTTYTTERENNTGGN